MIQITIENLYKKLQEQIKKAVDLDEYYIGKAKDVQRRAQQHKHKDNLPIAITLAKGKEDIIIKGEKYLEKMFQNDSRCLNKQLGGGPKEESLDYLYFSYRRKNGRIQSIDELYDEEFEWNEIYSLIQ